MTELRDVGSPLTDKMLRPLAKASRVQFTRPLTHDEFRRLAVLLAAHPDAELRVYGGWHQTVPDLDFLRFFPTLRRFAVDVFDLTSLEGLAYLPPDLIALRLGQTRKRLSLAPLARFTGLRVLSIEKHTKDLEVIQGFADLRTVSLRSLSLPDLSVLAAALRLEGLSLCLGGTRDLSLLPGFPELKAFHAMMVRGLSDITPISDTVGLEHLELDTLKHVEAIPPLHRLSRLTAVRLEGMSNLTDASPLLSAPALAELELFAMPNINIDSLAQLSRHPTLRAATVGTGGARKNDAARAALGLPATGRRFAHPIWTT